MAESRVMDDIDAGRASLVEKPSAVREAIELIVAPRPIGTKFFDVLPDDFSARCLLAEGQLVKSPIVADEDWLLIPQVDRLNYVKNLVVKARQIYCDLQAQERANERQGRKS